LIEKFRYVMICVLGDRLWQYWKKQLNSGIPHLHFNFTIKKPIYLRKPTGATYEFHLGYELKLQVTSVAKLLGITTYHVLMTGFMILLSKYTTQTDINTLFLYLKRAFDVSEILYWLVSCLHVPKWSMRGC
jgi:hypothetical protein